MINARRLAVFLVAVPLSAQLVGACADDGDGAGGAGPSAGAAGATAGGSDGGAAGAAHGGTAGTALGGSPYGGAAGAPECLVVDCEGLDEESCEGFVRSGSVGGCLPAYGTPFLGEGGAPRYAGCATRCCGLDCEEPPATNACAHPEADPSACWTLTSPPAPDGWVLLSEVEPCDAFPQCTE